MMEVRKISKRILRMVYGGLIRPLAKGGTRAESTCLGLGMWCAMSLLLSAGLHMVLKVRRSVG